MERATQTPISSSGDPVAPVSASADLSGQILGDYRLLRPLGQGGMGQVYLAEQGSLKRKVALKILKADLAVNPTALQRFKAEAEAIARVSHTNIVQVYAIGEAQGLHFMALEYVEGRTLREYLAKKGPPNLAGALNLMRQVAAALQRAGELGIIHRDIKPENILLTPKGEIKVADFGLSRCFAISQPLNLTQTGVTMGTPLYMSPEQIEGRPLDPRTDIYSFGVTCYHLLTGQPPFRGETAFEVALKHVRDEPALLHELRPDLPSELGAIVHKMMAKAPEQRYQTCRDLLQDLNRLRDFQAGLTTQPVEASAPTPAGPTAPLPKSLPRPRLLPWMAVAALTVVLALAGGAGLAWIRNRPPPAPPSEPAPPPRGASEPLFSQQEREQFLKQAVQQYANPGDDRSRRDLGLRHSLELGLLYLEQRQFDEADRFFTSLRENPAQVPVYRTLGRVGRALVLAFQDRAVESNQLFLQLASDRRPEGERMERARFLYINPQLRYRIACALDHNAANLRAQHQPFPDELQYLRKPPSPESPAGGPGRSAPDKSAGKN
jgi:serine/threonine protein kinase